MEVEVNDHINDLACHNPIGLDICDSNFQMFPPTSMTMIAQLMLLMMTQIITMAIMMSALPMIYHVKTTPLVLPLKERISIMVNITEDINWQ